MSKNNGSAEKTKNQDLTVFELIEYSFSDIEDVEVKPVSNSFIVEEGINIFLAPAGQGKTLLLYTLLLNYLRNSKVCVYVDFDNPVDLPKDRGLVDVIKSEGLQGSLYYINTNHYLRWIEKYNGKKKYIVFLKQVFSDIPEGSVVFIDSIQNFIDVNDQNQTTSFMKTLRHLTNLKKATVFAIHHLARSTGKSKGHTQIEDMADSVYHIKAHKNNALVEAWSLTASKQRYRTSPELTIRLLDNFKFEVSDVAILDDTTLAVLRFAVSYIRKNEGKVRQSELIDETKKKFVSVGERKIFYIFKDFVDRGLFKETTGVKNAKYYEVNEDSSYLKILFEKDLSDTKKELLEELKTIKELPEEIELKRSDGAVLMFPTPEAVRKAIFKLSDDEVKFILDKLRTANSKEGIEGFDELLEKDPMELIEENEDLL
jgi:archaellum biogenesis ATPase FlaH